MFFSSLLFYQATSVWKLTVSLLLIALLIVGSIYLVNQIRKNRPPRKDDGEFRR